MLSSNLKLSGPFIVFERCHHLGSLSFLTSLSRESHFSPLLFMFKGSASLFFPTLAMDETLAPFLC